MYEYHTLPNGIKIILSHTPSKVVYAGVYINVGSRDETGADEGMAHFIEHSLFKGTTHRRAPAAMPGAFFRYTVLLHLP